MDQVRYGDYAREMRVRSEEVSYSLLNRPAESAELPSRRPERLQLTGMDVYRLLAPYTTVRFKEQFRAVAPLAIYLALFQWLVLGQTVSDAAVIGAGLLAVMLGLMLFMEGLKLGLMPLGERMGNTLPRKVGLAVVLSVTFVLGVGVTFAEPAIGALQVAGSIVNPATTPHLYALLTTYSTTLVLAVGAGVGLAAVLGTLRFVYGWSLKPFIYACLLPTIGLTAWVHSHPELRSVIGLAWDLGAVTTGPVTVPLVLALGIGVAGAVGRGDASLSGFGIVTMASLLPILLSLLLAIVIHSTVPPQALSAMATESASPAASSWTAHPAAQAAINAARAILPLVAFLALVLRLASRERFSDAPMIRYGIVLAVAGMALFNLGLSYGLAKLGDQSGRLVPGAFTTIPAISASPLYPYVVGVALAAGFAWLLGFGATLAEPALNALGITVENLTNGAFKKSFLLYAVSFGVGVGIALGVLKTVFAWDLAVVLIPAYALAVALTALSSEEYVNVAWDSAGVTTGPVTVPLVLAMGLGLGEAAGAIEGFGILAAASIGPIVSVMAVGLFVQWRARRAPSALQTITQEMEIP